MVTDFCARHWRFRALARAHNVLAPESMRTITLALIFALSPALAAAHPITIGATIGETQSEVESENNQGPDRTYGGFVRVGITRHISTQFEVSRIDSDPTCDVWTATLLAVIEGNGFPSQLVHGRFVPIVLLGVGESWGTTADVVNTTDYMLDLVAGLGVEYRAANGFVLGVQARLGERSLQTTYAIYSVDTPPGQGPYRPEYEGLWAGQFRSVLLTGGWTF